MSKYTISCSKEQVEKSLKLGAEEELLTAEEMIGWLEEQGIFIYYAQTTSGFISWIKTNNYTSDNLGYFPTHKEATLAAIDAALEYLSNK